MHLFGLRKWVFILLASMTSTVLDAQMNPKDSAEVNAAKKSGLPQWIHDMVYDTLNSGKPRYLVYPTIGYTPETKWEFGVSSIVVFHANNDTSLRLSEISAFAFYTQEKQLGLWVDHAIYGRDNRFLTLGRMRFQDYPLSYYGIGNHLRTTPLAVVPANYYSVRERFVYRLTENLFSGLELDYQQLQSASFDWKDGSPINERVLPVGYDGSRNLGIGLGLIWDSRHNILNVREGFLAEIAYLNYPDLFSTSHPMETWFIDGRYFVPTRKNQVLAMQVLGQFSAGEQLPFNQLSMMGGEMMMRGYYFGRYRDKNYLAAQAEYRFLPFDFSRRLGGAIFGAVGAVSDEFPSDNYKWTVGGGLRYLLFPKKDIFTRIDVGFNPDGYGIYFYIGEAF